MSGEGRGEQKRGRGCGRSGGRWNGPDGLVKSTIQPDGPLFAHMRQSVCTLELQCPCSACS